MSWEIAALFVLGCVAALPVIALRHRVAAVEQRDRDRTCTTPHAVPSFREDARMERIAALSGGASLWQCTRCKELFRKEKLA